MNSMLLLRRLDIQIVSLTAAILALALSFLSINAANHEIEQSVTLMKQQAIILANNLASSSARFVFNKDYASIENALLLAARFPGIVSISVYDADNTPISEVLRGADNTIKPVFNLDKIGIPEDQNLGVATQHHYLVVWEPIFYGVSLGWIKTVYNLGVIQQKKGMIIREGLLNGAMIIILAIFLVMIFLYRPFRTIRLYTEFAHHLKSDYGSTISVNQRSLELECLGNALNSTSITLRQQNDSLIATLEKAERLAAFPQHSPIITLSVSASGRITFFNHAAEQFAAALPDGVVVSDLLPQQSENWVTKVLSENVEVQVESTQFEHFLHWTFAPVGNQQMVHCYAIDLTPLKQAEEEVRAQYVETQAAQLANQAKSTFLANMSHEIRTPLTAIIGFSEALLDRDITMSERVQAIHTVSKAGKHLLQLINDILDISKIESGRQEVERIPVSLFDLIEDVRTINEFKAQEKGLKFVVDYAFPLPETINTDPVRVKQILINLCSNALKFTHKGRIVLSVGYAVETRQMAIEVIDTGIGMTPEQLSTIFGAFSQADVSTTRSYGGTGLGLHLSQKLAYLLSGSLEVSSQANAGSRFVFNFPSGVAAGAALVSTPTRSAVLSAHKTENTRLRGHILLAEDNVHNQELIRFYIKKVGATLSIANNGEEAVYQVAHGAYDLLLMDMQMPVMDGLEAVIKIRESGNDVPIVMLTAHNTKEFIAQCEHSGANHFLRKPIEREAFFSVLADYLSVDTTEDELSPLVSSLMSEGDGLNTDIIRSMLQKFVHSLPDKLRSIKQALLEKDWVQLKFLMHQFKGAIGNYGYMDLYDHMHKMEFEVAKASGDTLWSLYETLEKLCERIYLGLDSPPPE